MGPSDDTRVAGEHDIESISGVKGGKKKLQWASFMHCPQALRVWGPMEALGAIPERYRTSIDIDTKERRGERI